MFYELLFFILIRCFMDILPGTMVVINVFDHTYFRIIELARL